MQKVPMTPDRHLALMRKKFGLADGDVVLDDQGATLRVLSVREAVHSAQSLAAPYLKQAGSLADSLVEDRRAEAAMERGDG
jgi:hypothetical protein